MLCKAAPAPIVVVYTVLVVLLFVFTGPATRAAPPLKYTLRGVLSAAQSTAGVRGGEQHTSPVYSECWGGQYSLLLFARGAAVCRPPPPSLRSTRQQRRARLGRAGLLWHWPARSLRALPQSACVQGAAWLRQPPPPPPLRPRSRREDPQQPTCHHACRQGWCAQGRPERA